MRIAVSAQLLHQAATLFKGLIKQNVDRLDLEYFDARCTVAQSSIGNALSWLFSYDCSWKVENSAHPSKLCLSKGI